MIPSTSEKTQSERIFQEFPQKRFDRTVYKALQLVINNFFHTKEPLQKIADDYRENIGAMFLPFGLSLAGRFYVSFNTDLVTIRELFNTYSDGIIDASLTQYAPGENTLKSCVHAQMMSNENIQKQSANVRKLLRELLSDFAYRQYENVN